MNVIKYPAGQAYLDFGLTETRMKDYTASEKALKVVKPLLTVRKPSVRASITHFFDTLMKPVLNNLNEALSYQLEGMYDAEKKLQKALPDCFNAATSQTLKNEIKKYFESTQDKRLKLKRIFSYLLVQPFNRKNNVIDKMLEDCQAISRQTNAKALRDAMLIGHLQEINHYKISSYGTAKAFASLMELQHVADLLGEVIAWEKETDQILTKIAMKEVNEKAAATAAV
jgi:ferritin-like metal-binding protein YciE